MKVCFETFGCRLNRAEALQQEAEYLAQGWELTQKHSEANLIIVRGCSVTRRAQRDCEKLIEHLRKRYPRIPVQICGCLNSVKSRPTPTPTPTPTPPIPTRTARAYLKCQDGCSGKCTFCIVPKFRGPSVSVPFEELMDKTRRFIDAGYHEIVLTGCNLALYASHGKRFPDLVAALADLATSFCRFRIGSLEPGACALETVDAMAERNNVCRFLHIPIQSGSNAILKTMNRPYQIKDVDELVDSAIGKMPLIGLGCDLMTGFPGETEIDFAATLGLVKRLAFSNAHVFPFSSRPGTLAAGLPNAVPRDLRHRRAHDLSALARTYRAKAAKRFVGRDAEVVIEDAEKLTGWTGEYFACEITDKDHKAPKRKDLVRVRVQEAKDDKLKAILV